MTDVITPIAIRAGKGGGFNDISFNYRQPDVGPVFYMDDASGLRFRTVLVNDKKFSIPPAMICTKGSDIMEVKDQNNNVQLNSGN